MFGSFPHWIEQTKGSNAPLRRHRHFFYPVYVEPVGEIPTVLAEKGPLRFQNRGIYIEIVHILT